MVVEKLCGRDRETWHTKYYQQFLTWFDERFLNPSCIKDYAVLAQYTHTLLLIWGESTLLWTWIVFQNNGPKIIKEMIFNIRIKYRVKYVPKEMFLLDVSRNMSKVGISRCNINHLLLFSSSSSFSFSASLWVVHMGMQAKNQLFFCSRQGRNFST